MAKTSFQIAQPLNKVWDAYTTILKKHGNINNMDKDIKRIDFKSNSLMSNYASITISLKKLSPKKTEIRMSGTSMEGLIKMGYAEKLMDKLSFELSNHFKPQEQKTEYKDDQTNFAWMVILIAIIVAAILFFLFFFRISFFIKIIP